MNFSIIGKPNAGKSTLFNRLIKSNRAITTDIPGTTRDWKEGVVVCGEKKFTLIDTAGIEKNVHEKLKEGMVRGFDEMIGSSDLLIFLTDYTTGVTKEDLEIARQIKKSKKEIILVTNKINDRPDPEVTGQFYRLGLGEPIFISAINGQGLPFLLEILCDKAAETSQQEDLDVTKISIFGRPNVGKTSFLNKLLGKERFLVSDVPGTTRDVNLVRFTHNEKAFEIIDTAGLRRRGKIGKGSKAEGIIEKFSAERTKKTLEKCDIAILLIDALEGVTSQDQHIAGFIKDAKKRDYHCR